MSAMKCPPNGIQSVPSLSQGGVRGRRKEKGKKREQWGAKSRISATEDGRTSATLKTGMQIFAIAV
jgi:hypothetical protein